MKCNSFLLAALLCGSYACSSDSPATNGACNALIDDGPTISLTASNASPPPPSGGTVVDGTYALMAATLFGSGMVPPTTFSAVMQIMGKTMQQVGKIDGQEKRYTSTFTLAGTSVTTMDSCPGPNTATHQFTATPSELRIYDASALGTLEQKYAKR